MEKLNRNALAIARDVARETGTLLASNLSNTWEYQPDRNKSKKIVRSIFGETDVKEDHVSCLLGPVEDIK